MRKLVCLCLFACILLLSACGEAAVPQSSAPVRSDGAGETLSLESTESKSGEATQPERSVSALAQEWLMEPAENYSWEREEEPEFIVLHFSSDVVAHPEKPYSAQAVRQIFIDQEVSANYLVDRDGTIYCLIREDRCAWHAGAGTWQGEERLENKMNRYSFGIEILGMGTKEEMAQYMSAQAYDALPQEWIGFTEAQYQAVAALVQDLARRYGISMDRTHVLGHDEYSPSKADPGSLFDWSRILPESRS